MKPALAAPLRQQCPASPNATDDPTVDQDVVTPNVLDNQYYRNQLNGSVLFTSDAALLTSARTNVLVRLNALVPGLFQVRFAQAMVKMAGTEVSEDRRRRRDQEELPGRQLMIRFLISYTSGRTIFSYFASSSVLRLRRRVFVSS
jgi:hypothetical protein